MDKKFEKINKELKNQIETFEKKNGKNFCFDLKQNDALVHNMKLRGKLFEQIELDSEFESADLLDFLGYERIISCKKNNNK